MGAGVVLWWYCVCTKGVQELEYLLDVSSDKCSNKIQVIYFPTL